MEAKFKIADLTMLTECTTLISYENQFADTLDYIAFAVTEYLFVNHHGKVRNMKNALILTQFSSKNVEESQTTKTAGKPFSHAKFFYCPCCERERPPDLHICSLLIAQRGTGCFSLVCKPESCSYFDQRQTNFFLTMC